MISALVLVGMNLYDQHRAAVSSQAALEELLQQLPKTSPEEDPLALELLKKPREPFENPYMPMPTIRIDGMDYIGYLAIPDLGLTLPVCGETTSSNLLTAPCRFYGSAYTGNLVIGAHNYAAHFGRIWELDYGDRVTFTDMAGNVFLYEVADTKTLMPYEAGELCSGEWALTLFTCTFGGAQRMVISCRQAAQS